MPYSSQVSDAQSLTWICLFAIDQATSYYSLVENEIADFDLYLSEMVPILQVLYLVKEPTLPEKHHTLNDIHPQKMEFAVYITAECWPVDMLRVPLGCECPHQLKRENLYYMTALWIVVSTQQYLWFIMTAKLIQST